MPVRTIPKNSRSLTGKLIDTRTHTAVAFESARRLQEAGQQTVDEGQLFAAYNRLKAIEEAAVGETKAARRKGQRQRLQAALRLPMARPSVGAASRTRIRGGFYRRSTPLPKSKALGLRSR